MQTGRTPCEDTGRDGDDASTSQDMPKIDSKPLDVMGETRDRSLSQPSEGTNLDFKLLASRTRRQ